MEGFTITIVSIGTPVMYEGPGLHCAQRVVTPVNMGEIHLSGGAILESNISTCVSVCLYHRGTRLGGMTHISKALESTSGGIVPGEGDYRYAANAIRGLVELFRLRIPLLDTGDLVLYIAGGYENEPPVVETIRELGLGMSAGGTLRTTLNSKYHFKLRGWDINDSWYRKVSLDPPGGILRIEQYRPFIERREPSIVRRIQL
jgi:chemotaxis receptor (MCP) glutamine deamidase CheD